MLLRFGMDVVEHGLPGLDIRDETIQRRDDHIRINVAVVGKERRDVAKRRLRVIRPIVPRKQQAPEPAESRMAEERRDRVVDTETLQVRS